MIFSDDIFRNLAATFKYRNFLGIRSAMFRKVTIASYNSVFFAINYIAHQKKKKTTKKKMKRNSYSKKFFSSFQSSGLISLNGKIS